MQKQAAVGNKNPGNAAANEPRMSPDIQNSEQPPRPKWQARLKALRNIPPVFGMVWEAAPGIVVSSFIFRLLVSVVPVAMLWVTKLIIDAVYQHLSAHAALPRFFWWLVGWNSRWPAWLRFLRARMISATRFWPIGLRAISARGLWSTLRGWILTSFEDPAFYDKMDRARVQGTDRVMMIQMSGRLIQEVITTVSLAAGIFFFSPWLLFLSGGLRGAGVYGRDALCVSRLFAEFCANSGPAAAGLSADCWREQG